MRPTMLSKFLLLVAALALACLALGAQARDLQQVGDEAEALIAQQVAAQVGSCWRRCGWAGRRQTGSAAHCMHGRLGPAASCGCLDRNWVLCSCSVPTSGCTQYHSAPNRRRRASTPLQEEKIQNYREFEQDHNDAQEQAAASGSRKGGRGKKGRHNTDNGSDGSSGGIEITDGTDGSDAGSGDGAHNPWYGRDPSDLSKAEKRKARREAKKLGMSLDEYLGWTGGSGSGDGSSYEKEAPRKKGRKGRRSGPADDSADVPVTKGRRGRGGKGGKRATYHYCEWRRGRSWWGSGCREAV